MAEAGDEETQYLQVAQDAREAATVLEEGVAEVSHREGMGPVVVGRIAITFLHHQYKPVQCAVR
jgi:hypothetical protein